MPAHSKLTRSILTVMTEMLRGEIPEFSSNEMLSNYVEANELFYATQNSSLVMPFAFQNWEHIFQDKGALLTGTRAIHSHRNVLKQRGMGKLMEVNKESILGKLLLQYSV